MEASLCTTSIATLRVSRSPKPHKFQENHPVKIKYEKNNYELAQQDRTVQDKNLCVQKGDLGFLDPKPKLPPTAQEEGADKEPKEGEEGEKAEGEEGEKVDGEEKEESKEPEEAEDKVSEIDEEMLNEMCNFNNATTANNVVQTTDKGEPFRRTANLQALCETRAVVEEFDIYIDGDQGEGGRPRVKEEVKLPP